MVVLRDAPAIRPARLVALALLITLAIVGVRRRLGRCAGRPHPDVHRVGPGVDPGDGLTGWARATARTAATGGR